MVRLVALWTKPADAETFEREYLRSHFPQLDRLENALDATVSTCHDGPFFQIAEVSFANVDDLYAALDTELGKHVLESAQRLADAHGARIEVLVVGEAR
jgi:hypothetical protein